MKKLGMVVFGVVLGAAVAAGPLFAAGCGGCPKAQARCAAMAARQCQSEACVCPDCDKSGTCTQCAKTSDKQCSKCCTAVEKK